MTVKTKKVKCEECDGIGVFDEQEAGRLLVRVVCSHCKGEGTLTVTVKYWCDYHPKEEVRGKGGMCWICIAEDEDFRKHRRRVWGS